MTKRYKFKATRYDGTKITRESEHENIAQAGTFFRVFIIGEKNIRRFSVRECENNILDFAVAHARKMAAPFDHVFSQPAVTAKGN